MDKKIEALIKDQNKFVKKLSNDELVELLQKLSDAYYNSGESLVSDDIYDFLIDTLKERDPGNEFLKKVGAPVKGTREKVNLPFEMGSLLKLKPGNNDVETWAKKYPGPYFISDKLDGASAQIYKNQSGEVFMFSRGDGEVGQNISHLLPYVISKSTAKSIPNGTSIRGELIISKDNFKKVAKRMKNARNTVSGLISSKTVDEEVADITTFVSYAIINPRYDYKKQMDLLESWKFEVVSHKFVDKVTEDFFKEHLTKRKEGNKYEMDGIVCVDCSKVYSHQGGYREHEFAFKMLTSDQIATATVDSVIWNPTKDGYLKPTVKIVPVDLLGVTIKKASGFNAKFIVDNKIGPGAIIKLVRSGDVIPDIHEVIKPAKEPQMPDFPYKWNSTKVDLILKDENDANGKRIVTIKILYYFFSTIGVKYLGEGIITKLVDNGYDSVEKILSAKKKELVTIDGLGDSIVDKITEEIDRAFSEITLETFMAASGKLGRGLGRRKLAEIINIYPNILKEDEDGLDEKIMKVPGFSDKSTELFITNFKSFKEFYKRVSKIKDLSRFDKIKVAKTGGKFDDKSFVLTGSRDAQIIKFIEDNGGKITGSVSKNTEMVIHADNADTSTNKFVKATELNIPLIKVSEFIKKYITIYK
jgi:NAD-dependent DNA ligase